MTLSRGGLSERCAMGECDACLGCRDDCHVDHGASWNLTLAEFCGQQFTLTRRMRSGRRFCNVMCQRRWDRGRDHPVMCYCGTWYAGDHIACVWDDEP